METIVFEDCAGCVRKRKNYKQSLKNIPKSIENHCKIHAGNDYTKNIENNQNGAEIHRKLLKELCRDFM